MKEMVCNKRCKGQLLIIFFGLMVLTVLMLVSVASAAPFAYITNYNDDNVSVIDISNNTVTATVPVGNDPYGVAVNPNGKNVYVANTGSNTSSVIDASSNTVTATVPVEIGPYGVAFSPDGTKVYVTNYRSLNVSVINTISNTVTGTVNVGIGSYGIAVSPNGAKAYVTNWLNHTVSVIDTVGNTVTGTVNVGSQPIGIIVSSDGSKVYVANKNSNTISVIDTTTNTVTRTVPVGGKPVGVAINPNGTKVYVTNEFSGNVSVIDTATDTVTATVAVGMGPSGVSVSPDGTKVYVAYDKISVIDTATNTVTATVPVGKTPIAFGQFIGKVPPELPVIKITYPLDGAQVDVTESVKGTQGNIPPGDEIWIFVHPDGNKYYPQRSNAVIQNGEWSLSVGIGSENDAGKKFDIIAVLADKKAQEEINSYFAECEKTHVWPGMDKVPDSAKEYNRVTVTRLPVTPEINITYPSDGAKVGVTESVKGTQKNIPKDKAIWIVVFPYKSYNYHPVKAVHIQEGRSDFSVPVTIGRPESVGEEFDIIAVLADKQAQEVFTNYLKTAIESNNYTGISNLPAGAEEKYNVKVTRK